MGSEGAGQAFLPSHRCPTAGTAAWVWEGEGKEGARWQRLHPGWDSWCSASSKRLLGAFLPLGHLGPQPGSGNCTSGAGGLGGPEGGPAAVRGCCLSPPSIMTQKSRVGDAAWGSVTLGSGHSSGSPRLHPQPPRCLPGKGAPLSPPANGLAPVLEGAGTIVQGTMSPGSLRSLGRWGSPEEALPGRPSAFWKAFLGSLPRPHAVCVQRPMGPCGLAVGVRPWLLGSRRFPVQGKRGWRESGFCPGPSRWQRAGMRGLSWVGPDLPPSALSRVQPCQALCPAGLNLVRRTSGLLRAVLWDRLPLGETQARERRTFSS